MEDILPSAAAALIFLVGTYLRSRHPKWFYSRLSLIVVLLLAIYALSLALWPPHSPRRPYVLLAVLGISTTGRQWLATRRFRERIVG